MLAAIAFLLSTVLCLIASVMFLLNPGEAFAPIAAVAAVVFLVLIGIFGASLRRALATGRLGGTFRTAYGLLLAVLLGGGAAFLAFVFYTDELKRNVRFLEGDRTRLEAAETHAGQERSRMEEAKAAGDFNNASYHDQQFRVAATEAEQMRRQVQSRETLIPRVWAAIAVAAFVSVFGLLGGLWLAFLSRPAMPRPS